ncbi:hypothetical protein [Paenibacillus sp. N3.4]|uniref:hypothetical protein n=1 Tax=Paenibacillus sp. N3.4 TaxID=2603222 RepID=UPI001C9CFC3A|nr:hypothetical protein [Paenibacillus sp. N3.4]
MRNQCSDCSRSLDGLLTNCHEFLRKNHRSTSEQLSSVTGVPLEQLYGWMREGKLLMTDYPNLSYPCAACSRSIRKQKFCTDCLFRINKEINELKDKDSSFLRLQKEKTMSTINAFQIRDRSRGV